MYTIDTNTIIYYLSGDEKADLILRDILQKNVPIYVSVVTELELLSFSRLSKQDLDKINTLLKTVVIISLDSQLARVAASLRSKYRLKTPDSIIAATAIITGSSLVTRNIKDFEHIAGLSLVDI